MKPKRCLVDGCPNRSDQGLFRGGLCAPCDSYLRQGEIGPTESFLGTLARKAQAFDAIVDHVDDARRNL